MKAFEPGQCVNCDSIAVTVKSPLYCSAQCRQAAKLVRYVRTKRQEGIEHRPDIKEAIRIRLAMVLGGGYPEGERRVSPETRSFVFERAGGRCESCGRALDVDRSTGDPDAVATIQHVAGNSNDPSNLKAFCRRCNIADAESRFVPVEPGSPAEKLGMELTIRCSVPEPLRICDDEVRWKNEWRRCASEARELLRLLEDLDEGAGDEDLAGFMGWTDQGTPIQEC